MTLVTALVGVVTLSTACPATGEEVRPPADQMFFPAGLAVSPDESYLFVANANSDLRFDSGSLLIIDLAAVDELFDAWVGQGRVPPDSESCSQCCEVDLVYAERLVCNERRVVVASSTVRIGNFATQVGVQALSAAHWRLFVAVRGDPSVTWIDVAAGDAATDCGPQEPFPTCSEAHRLSRFRQDRDLPPIPEEPFGLFVDSQNGYVLVTHLTTASVSLVDAPPQREAAPQLADQMTGLFAANARGVRGAVGVAGRRPGSTEDLIYVTSRSESRVRLFTVQRLADGLPTLVPSEYFFLSEVNRAVNPADDARGIVFTSGGERAHIINRQPPMLYTVDTSLDRHGFPKNEVVGAVEICANASVVAAADVGRGERIYLACFRDNQIWVIDPASSRLETMIQVGRGPHSLALARAKKRLYIANFLEDTIAVVDLAPGAARENRAVLQLGRTRQAGGE